MALPDEPVIVLGDPMRLRQIAWHLLANAIKFTPRGGRVDVDIASSTRETTLRIADSGSGIDPDFLPHVFERFTQADPSPTRTAGGLGVGLSLVRELVELHGGRIEARNRTDGHGAVFAATLPRQPASLLERGRVPPIRPAAAAVPWTLEGVRVLVLDQDCEGRELLRTLLQGRGALVKTVGSVAEALETLEGWRPDVLVSDNGSPERDKYTLVGKVHSLDRESGGRIPALALTAAARTDQRLAPMLAGVHCDLPKPVEPDALTTEIARLTGRERRHAPR
jgi:CheY-like chemotaxis protein